MSNPTTPFNWQMPTSTDLVTDLPADFEVFGQAVATSMGDLLGGTTGQILSKATNTDMDFVWIANDQGDITGVTATTPLTGGGTSGAITVGIQDASTSQKGSVQLSDSTSTTSSILAATPTAVKASYDLAAAAIPKSTVTTAGDLIVATGASAVSRIGIGTNGQVLSSNGTTATWTTPSSGMTNPMTTTGDIIYSSPGSTPVRRAIGSTGDVLTVSGGIPTWAAPSSGGMTLISTTSLSGATTTISSIPQTYNYLHFIVENSGTTTSDPVLFKPNNTDFATNWQFASSVAAPTYVSSLTGTGAGSQYRLIVINLWNYTSTASTKGMTYSTFGNTMSNGYASFQSLSAITSVVFAAYSGNFNGGTVKMYGVK